MNGIRLGFFMSLLRTLTTFLTNSSPSVIYPLIPDWSHLMFHHYILISHIMKVLMLVNVFYALPLTKPFPLAHSVTSLA